MARGTGDNHIPHTCKRTRAHIDTHACTHARTHARAHARTHAYIQTHTHTHTHTNSIRRMNTNTLCHQCLSSGQFGWPTFGAGAFVGMLAATISSIVESIGDYYATARICALPPPPKHTINRGIAIEGLASVMSGFFGVCHGTTSYSGVIGFIGVTGVRRLCLLLNTVLIMVSYLYAVLFKSPDMSLAKSVWDQTFHCALLL